MKEVLSKVSSTIFSSNIELGKFFPAKSGISIPMFIGWNENFINPKFYPLNPDILYQDALNFAPNEQEKIKVREVSQDYTSRYSLNFQNVKKNRVGNTKSHIWEHREFQLLILIPENIPKESDC